MKHPVPFTVMFILLAACALGLASCVGSDIMSSNAPDSVLNPESTYGPGTNQAPGGSTIPQAAPSLRVRTVSPSSRPLEGQVQQNDQGLWLPWLALLLFLMDIWLWYRYRRNKAASARRARLAGEMIVAQRTLPAPRAMAAKEAPLTRIVAAGKAVEPVHEEILVEGAGLNGMVKVAVRRGATFQEIIVSVAKIGNFPAKEAHLFLEDEDVPLDPNHQVDAKHPRHKVHHVHTQKEIGVLVHFNGLDREASFSPATTVQKVLAWAAAEFKIPFPESGEARLALPGSSEPLQATAHIGRYVPHHQNKLPLYMQAPAGITG